MAYRLDMNKDYSIYRSRHTGAIGFWQRNSAYGYYAAIEYLAEGEKLTLTKLDEWAIRAGETPETVRALYTTMIREGGRGMRPQPDFSIPAR